MTEKEFLIKFSNWLLVTKLEAKGRTDVDYYVDDFLEEHHKEYYEVEFVKKRLINFHGVPIEFDKD